MWSWKVHLPRPHSCECGRGRLLTLPRPQFEYCGRGRVPFHDHNFNTMVVEGDPSTTTLFELWSWKGQHLPRPHSQECGRGRCTFHDHTYKSVVVESGKISSASSLFISLQHFLSSSTLHSLSLFTRRRLLPSRASALSPPPSRASTRRRLLPFHASALSRLRPLAPSPSLSRVVPSTLRPLLPPPPPFLPVVFIFASLRCRLPLHSRPPSLGRLSLHSASAFPFTLPPPSPSLSAAAASITLSLRHRSLQVSRSLFFLFFIFYFFYLLPNLYECHSCVIDSYVCL